MIPEGMKERILDYLEHWYSHRDINKKTGVSLGTISKIRNEWDDDWLWKLNEVTDTVKTYNIDWWYYVFETKDNYWEDETVKVLIQTIDNIFKDYSKHWNNLSWEEIIQKYKLKPEVFTLLKNRLRLYKSSHVISPHTLDNMEEWELEWFIENIVDETTQDRYRRIFDKKRDNKKKREITRLSLIENNFDWFLSNLEKMLDNKQWLEIKMPNKKYKYNNKVIDVAFSDIHIWKINTDGVIKRLNKLKNYLISREESIVNIMFLWDLAECLVEWWMHPWQIEEMEFNWFELMMYTVDVFSSFLLDLHSSGKRIMFRGMWWNHDRLGKDHWQDNARTWALVIYELLKRTLPKLDIWYYKENITWISWDNFHYILHHWDDWFSQKALSRPEDILWKNWNKNKYNIIIYWDKHNISVKETKWATIIWLPAMAWQWIYDKRLDLHSEPWVVIVTKNQDWTPDILIKRFT